MTYCIWTGTNYIGMTQTELARMLGADGAANILNGWTVRGMWRVY